MINTDIAPILNMGAISTDITQILKSVVITCYLCIISFISMGVILQILHWSWNNYRISLIWMRDIQDVSHLISEKLSILFKCGMKKMWFDGLTTIYFLTRKTPRTIKPRLICIKLESLFLLIINIVWCERIFSLEMVPENM